MPDVKVTLPKSPQQPAAHPSVQKRARRLSILKEVRGEHGGHVRVVPEEKYRGVLKHPSGIRFRAEGGMSWPNDKFTQRRLRDGSVKLEEKKEEKKDEPKRSTSSAPAPSAN